MPAHKIDIKEFLELNQEVPVLDVRSPAEFNHAHIPGAYNVPLFSDEERKMVGTAYKQEGREQAIKTGLEFFGPRMKQLVETTEAIIELQKQNKESGNTGSVGNNNPAKSVRVHCWRGGMRSEALAWLLDLYGFNVFLLRGGYKKFRRHVLETFTQPFHLNILGGFTGSGKTELLKALHEKGEYVIDLESLANHKGSAFGNIGMPDQPGQEMFENLLATELFKFHSLQKEKTLHNDLGSSSGNTKAIWIEDESQRIGGVNIPNEFWNTMRRSRIFFLDIPFDVRLTHIVSEYGGLNREKLTDAIGRISPKLGGLNATKAITYLEEDNIKDCFSILLSYYDRFYFKALHNRESVHSLLYNVPCSSITPENANSLVQIPEPEKY